MTDCKDVVYLAIYKGALKVGADERASHNAATTGLDDYKKNRFKKATTLIMDKIKEAKRMTGRKG